MRHNIVFQVSVVFFTVILIIFVFILMPTQPQKTEAAPLRHFGLIAGNVKQPLWQDIYSGMLQYAEENNIAIEMLGPEYFDLNEHIYYLKLAAACNLDGLIFPAFAEEPYRTLIDDIKENGIPIVTIMYDLPDSSRDSYVGIDPEELGDAVALLIDNATDGKANITVIKSSLLEPDDHLNKSDPVIQGIVDAVKQREGLNVSYVKSSPYGIFSAEEIARDILLNHRNVNAFFCDSVDSTLGVTQMVIDLNRVGQLAIVGFMRNDDIDRYLETNIISGIIHADSYEMGRRAIAILNDLSENKPVSSFVKIGFSVIFSP